MNEIFALNGRKLEENKFSSGSISFLILSVIVHFHALH